MRGKDHSMVFKSALREIWKFCTYSSTLCQQGNIFTCLKICLGLNQYDNKWVYNPQYCILKIAYSLGGTRFLKNAIFWLGFWCFSMHTTVHLPGVLKTGFPEVLSRIQLIAGNLSGHNLLKAVTFSG